MIEKTLHDGAARLIYGMPNLESLKLLPDNSIHCCVTSPPYWALRDYGAEEQLGLETHYQDYINNMVLVFREVRRVLHPTGTLWLNLGDSYVSSSSKGSGGPSAVQDTNAGSRFKTIKVEHDLKHKDLVGIPWRVAFALQADGWYLRQDIIWAKNNPMPESVTDRCSKAHEYIFLLTKSDKYYYDHVAIKEPAVMGAQTRKQSPTVEIDNTRNKRSVWQINTQSYSGAHFAVFPEEIPELCIKASTSEKGICPACGNQYKRQLEKVGFRQDRWSEANSFDGYRERKGTLVYKTVGWEPTCKCPPAPITRPTVLDPFSGSGTTGKVALRLGQHYIGLDVNEEYLDLALRRVDQYTPDVPSEAEADGSQPSLFNGLD